MIDRVLVVIVALRRPLLAASLLMAMACGGLSSTPPARPEARPAVLLPEDRLALPEFGFERFQSLLSELRGRPVVVNIWGSWCPPCRIEAPDLTRVSREFEGRVQFLGVDILDTRPPAREFILAFDWPYPSVFDPDGEIRDRLGYLGQPVTVIYDRDGRVAFEWTGIVTADLLRDEIGNVLSD